MVPATGLFAAKAVRKVYVSAEDQEREGYLSEVMRDSTEFGVGRRGSGELPVRDEGHSSQSA